MCIEGAPVEIQTAAQWNLIGRIMTALPPPVLSPSNVLPLPSSVCAFMPANKNPARLFKLLLFKFILRLKEKTFAKSGCVCLSVSKFYRNGEVTSYMKQACGETFMRLLQQMLEN
jgi:hypothetical protein